jgi:hypothetical protein
MAPEVFVHRPAPEELATYRNAILFGYVVRFHDAEGTKRAEERLRSLKYGLHTL